MSKTEQKIHEKFMQEAVGLSKQGFPAPNPRVGAVVVLGNEIVGRGFHEAAGLEHAEVVALKEAGSRSKGADLYVTLEPCNHKGKTPPCTEAILKSGIKRVIIACADPNPQAKGGSEFLQKNGVEVILGVLSAEAMKSNHVFMERFRLGRAHVLVKTAITLDGRIATKTGESYWITDETARARVHLLRAEMGCVLVGAQTVRHDNPSLTVRTFEVKNQPLRVVLDPNIRLPKTSKIFTDEEAKTIWVTKKPLETESDFVENLVVPVGSRGEFDLRILLDYLTERGVIGVLVEGGGRTIEAFFRQGLVDELELHVAPKIFGSGLSWIEGQGVYRVSDAWRVEDAECSRLGEGFRLRGRVKASR